MNLRGPLGDRGFRGQFSGHETFPIRYGWLKKIVDAVSAAGPEESGQVFNADIAMAHFGVGKNMVASMKHWGLAAGVIKIEKNNTIEVTDLGKLLLPDSGLDPYLENPASLWLIHWRIAASPIRTTTWFWAFNHYGAATVDRESLAADIARLCQDQGGLRRVSRATVRRDVDCFFRTYTVVQSKRGGLSEDSLECPLAELELIRPSSLKGVYEFARGEKPNLPDAVFSFALLEFWETCRDVETLSLEAIAYEPGSPGRVFKMDEQSVIARLARIEDSSNGVFRWSHTGGIQQVIRTDRPANPLDLLRPAFKSSQHGRAAA